MSLKSLLFNLHMQFFNLPKRVKPKNSFNLKNTPMNMISNDLPDDDYDYDWTAMASSLLLTSHNASAELKQQTVEVEYLKPDQWLMIPCGLGINPVTPDIGRATPRHELITRYWQMTRMAYSRMKELMQQNTPTATVLAEISSLESTPGMTLFTGWGTGAEDGNADPKNVVDDVYMFISKKAEMNFDIRDMGILNADNMSITDVAWRNINDVTIDRLDMKINEYSMQQISALNLVPCSNSVLAAWTRAYGVACGIMPHSTSRMKSEYCWTVSVAKIEDVSTCLAWEKAVTCSGKSINMVCLNVIALFGLLHLNKDCTFSNNDSNMNRICTSWLNMLCSITTKKMQNEIFKQKEQLCRIAAHPFGLAQTYWLGLVLGRKTDMLALRVDVSPPPVQRIMICEATINDWGKFRASEEVNTCYKKQIELIMQGVRLVRECPPGYSELYKFYGLDEKKVVNKEVIGAVETLMPAVFGFCKSKYGDKQKTVAKSMKSVERNNRVTIDWWTRKWNMDIDSMDKKEVKEAYPASTSG